MRQASGNVLFIIFVAVALFAALGFAISSGNRTGNTGLQQNQADLDSSELRACYTSVNAAITRLKANKNCKDSEISYELPSGYNANPNAPADKSCHLYDSAGAGLAPCRPEDEFTPVTYGDTTTTFPLIGGLIGKCNYWALTWEDKEYCALETSTDGVTFQEYGLCFHLQSGQPSYESRDWQYSFDYLKTVCTSACGGPGIAWNQDSTNGSVYTHYLSDASFTPVPLTENCAETIWRVACDCWQE